MSGYGKPDVHRGVDEKVLVACVMVQCGGCGWGHGSLSLQCLVQFNQDLICSGGSDLCLWDRKGKLFTKFCRKDLEEKSELLSCEWRVVGGEMTRGEEGREGEKGKRRRDTRNAAILQLHLFS